MAPLRDQYSIMVPGLPALSPRKEHYYYDPAAELYIGLWCLFSAATAFLGLRLWVKVQRRHGLWWDDYLLMLSWLILLGTDILITFECKAFAYHIYPSNNKHARPYCYNKASTVSRSATFKTGCGHNAAQIFTASA